MPRSIMRRSPASSSSPRRSGAAVQPDTRAAASSSLIRSIRRLLVSLRRPTRLPAIPEDVLPSIFIHLGSFTDLARTSAACAAFRRAIADRAFLRRFRSLRPPLLLGLVVYSEPVPGPLTAPAPGVSNFQRAEAPHRNAAVAHQFSCAAGFSFDYLPGASWKEWEPCDVRDGRVLLRCRKGAALSDDLAVCDPVFQRYFVLPVITDDLLAAAGVEDHTLCCFQPALVPASSSDDDETSFEVIARTYSATTTVVFLFSRSSGTWTVGAATSWDALNLSTPAFYDETSHYAHGCFFWRAGAGDKLLRLDTRTMEFSALDLPPELAEPTAEYEQRQRVLLAEAAAREEEEGEEGSRRLVLFTQSVPQWYGGDPAPVHYYTTTVALLEAAGGAHAWRREGTVPVPVPSEYVCSLKCAAQGYVFLVGTRESRGVLRAVCFSLEVRTLKVERVSEVRIGKCRIYPYFGFPVSMSPRTI